VVSEPELVLLDMVVGVMVLVDEVEDIIMVVVEAESEAPAEPLDEMLNCCDWA
jgi:hypothetical protein